MFRLLGLSQESERTRRTPARLMVWHAAASPFLISILLEVKSQPCPGWLGEGDSPGCVGLVVYALFTSMLLFALAALAILRYSGPGPGVGTAALLIAAPSTMLHVWIVFRMHRQAAAVATHFAGASAGLALVIIVFSVFLWTLRRRAARAHLS